HRHALARPVGVAGLEREVARPGVAGHHAVENPVFSVHDRGELGQDHLRDCHRVALALQHAREPRQVGLQPVLLLVLLRGLAQVADHLVDVVFEVGHLSGRIDPDRPGQVARGHRRRDLGDGSHLGGQRRRQLVDVVSEVAPRARGPGHVRLAAESSLGADLAGHRGDLLGEDGERGGHAVDGVGELGDLALGLEGELASQVAVRDRRDHARDAAHLVGEVGRHRVDVVGQVLPDAGNTLHVRLAAKLAVGADLARDAGDLFGERVQLVDHRVDGLLELQDLSADVDRALLGRVAMLDCRGDLGDVADLAGQVAGHEVDVVGQVLPDPGHALDVGLAAQLSFRADLAGDTRHLAREGVELVDHRVDGLLELEDLPADVDGDLLGQVALLDGGGDLGDVADLARQVAGHQVDVLGQVLPDADHAPDVALAAQLALATHFPYTALFRSREGVELVDHRVDGVLELEDLSADVDGDLLREVTLLDGRRDLGDVAHLAGQVAGHQVHVVGDVLPHAANPTHVRLATELALGAHLARYTRHLAREGVELAD